MQLMTSYEDKSPGWTSDLRALALFGFTSRDLMGPRSSRDDHGAFELPRYAFALFALHIRSELTVSNFIYFLFPLLVFLFLTFVL